MAKFLSNLPVCAIIALPMFLLASAPLLAQTATSDTAQTDAPAEAPAPQTDLNLGEDADANPEAGQPYFSETIGAWKLRCIKTDKETDPCQMYQLLADDKGAPIAEFSLFRLPDGGKAAAGATVVVPLETSLQNQLTIRVDNGSARRYPFAFCNPVGCYSRVGFTDEDVAAFKRGKAATLTIIPALAPDQKVELTLSLEGFTASYDKASVLEQ